MEEKMNSFTVRISSYRTGIMGMSMLSIMLFHQYFISMFPLNFFHNFGFWGVDVFLFLSGIGMVNSLRKYPIVTFYKRRFGRIVPSCLFCGIIKYIVFLQYDPSMLILKDGLNLGIWSIASLDLWFVHTILIFYIISPLLYHLINSYRLYTISVILFLFIINGLLIKPVVGYEWLSPIGILSWTIERLPVFFTGMFIAINQKKMKVNYILTYIFLFAAVCFNLTAKVNLSFAGIRACQLFFLAIGVPALIHLNMYFLKRTNSILLRFFVYLGKYSFEIYLVHEFIFWSMKVYMNNITSVHENLLTFLEVTL